MTAQLTVVVGYAVWVSVWEPVNDLFNFKKFLFYIRFKKQKLRLKTPSPQTYKIKTKPITLDRYIYFKIL